MEDDKRLEGHDQTAHNEVDSLDLEPQLTGSPVKESKNKEKKSESKSKKKKEKKAETGAKDDNKSTKSEQIEGDSETAESSKIETSKKNSRKRRKKKNGAPTADVEDLSTEKKKITTGKTENVESEAEILNVKTSEEGASEAKAFQEKALPAKNHGSREDLVFPDKVQVVVKKTDNPEAALESYPEQEVFDPDLFKIKVINKNEINKETKKSGTTQESNPGVQMNLQGAHVTIGEAKRRVIPRVQATPLPIQAVKVRNITGKVINVTAEVIKDKVIVQGIVHKQVFFVSVDGVVRHFAEDVPFSTFIDIPGADVGMNAQVHPVIEKILFHLSEDGLFVNQKVIIEIFVKVTQFIQTGLTLGEGPLLLLPLVIGEGTKQSLIENVFNLDIPAIKVDEIRGEIRQIEGEIIPDKVIIQGIVHKQIFFIDEDNLARHQAEDVQFSLFIDIPGAEPGMDLQIHPRIEGIFFELLSPTELRQKVVIEVFVKVTEAVQERVVVSQGPLFKVEQIIGEEEKQLLKESTIGLERPAIKIREIVGEVRNVSAEVIPDKVIIQGLVHKQIFFIGTDNIEYHQAEDVPFSLFIDLPGATPGLNARVRIIIEKILFQLLEEDTLHQKVILKVNVIVSETLQLPLEIGNFGLFKLEEVIGEGIRQILVERREEIPPIPPIPPIVRNVVVVEVVPPAEIITARQQIIVENVVKLPEKAIKIREVRGEIIDLRARVVTENGVLIDGFVLKEVFFVGRDNVVRSITERVPFSILVNLPGITPETPFTVEVQIEKISFTLSPDGRFLRQIIVLDAEVTAELPAPEPFQVVSDVTGPGITTERVLVRAPVLTETGVEVQEFFVVTEVSGPGIRRVETRVVMLDIVNDGNPNPVPIEVVTEVEFEPVVF